MKKRTQKLIGLILISIGVLIIILQSFPSITGAVIGISFNLPNATFIIGFSLIVIGIILFSSGLVELVEPPTIEWTKRFRKQVKGINPRYIDRAVGKIGKGLGDEKHRRHGEPYYQIRVDHGGRILYSVGENDEIVLEQYIPSSEHP